MTVIAWDGTTLAADKQNTASGYGMTSTKIFKVPAGLIGFAGNVPSAMRMIKWFKDGGGPHTNEGYPPFENDRGAEALLITKDFRVLFYGENCNGYPEEIEENFIAMGSGRDYALATMHLGHNAVKAVEVACSLDVFCGKGIDCMQMYEDPAEAIALIEARYTETNGIIRLNPDAEPKPYDMKIIRYLCDEWDFAFEA